ncbi:universal stress protein UspA-like protein [Thermanaerovibrio velox DSM 12556]|uniref:Universal stress protein n=1 Tax=Thermanaerovibrio velox DSM 12556 TaxID=926567 RepID=H0UNA7_9BACT|nr:universal stress protein [Thermanaerovibrio velox]EHM10392.1 universal stress protein UspA-like protein [Thermanaerovibrio velox DSM 12556]
MPKKMLVAADLSKLGESVVRYGYSLSHRLNIEATFLHVIPNYYIWRGYEPWLPPDINQEVQQIAEKKMRYFLKKAEEQLGYKDHPNHKLELLFGDPAEQIIEYAKKESMDLIVLGYKGHSTLENIIVGSTASKVARYAPCSVLIYRPGHEPI